MSELFIGLFLGWPAVVVTAILAVIGLLRDNYRFLVAAAILALPFSWLLSGFPIIRSPVFYCRCCSLLQDTLLIVEER